MKYKYFLNISVLLLLLFGLCACNKNQTKQEKEEEAKKETIYYEIEQNGVPEQEEKGYTFFIMKPDFGVFTEAENENIKNIDGVTETEYYGGAARTKYYYQLEKDYTFQEFDIFQAVDREKEEHFTRSAGNLTQDDLKEGRLPETENEIVLYTSDQSMLGKTIEIYFLCNDLFNQSVRDCLILSEGETYIEKEMVITGILQEKTDQIYFSEPFCDMLGKTMTECVLKYVIVSIYKAEAEEDTAVQDNIGPDGSIRIEGGYYENLDWNGEYKYAITTENNNAVINLIVYMDETLEKCRVSLPESYIETMEWIHKNVKGEEDFTYKIYDFLELTYQMPEDWIYPGIDKMKNGWIEDKFSIIGYGRVDNAVKWVSTDKNFKSHTIQLGIRDTLSKSGQSTIAVSRELFEAMHPDKGSKVISIYIEDGKEEEVKKMLMKQGYIEYQVPLQ